MSNATSYSVQVANYDHVKQTDPKLREGISLEDCKHVKVPFKDIARTLAAILGTIMATSGILLFLNSKTRDDLCEQNRAGLVLTIVQLLGNAANISYGYVAAFTGVLVYRTLIWNRLVYSADGVTLASLLSAGDKWRPVPQSFRYSIVWGLGLLFLAGSTILNGITTRLIYTQSPHRVIHAIGTNDTRIIANTNRQFGQSCATCLDGRPQTLKVQWEGLSASGSLPRQADHVDEEGFKFWFPQVTVKKETVTQLNGKALIGGKHNCTRVAGNRVDLGYLDFTLASRAGQEGVQSAIFMAQNSTRLHPGGGVTDFLLWQRGGRLNDTTGFYAFCQVELIMKSGTIFLDRSKISASWDTLREIPFFGAINANQIKPKAQYADDYPDTSFVGELPRIAGSANWMKPALIYGQKFSSVWAVGALGAGLEFMFSAGAHNTIASTTGWIETAFGGNLNFSATLADENVNNLQQRLTLRFDHALANINQVEDFFEFTGTASTEYECISSVKYMAILTLAMNVLMALLWLIIGIKSRFFAFHIGTLLAAHTTGSLEERLKGLAIRGQFDDAWDAFGELRVRACDARPQAPVGHLGIGVVGEDYQLSRDRKLN